MKKYVLLILVLVLISQVNAQDISLDKKEYLVGETVIIKIHTNGNTRIEILSPTNLYRFLGVPDNVLKFVPKETGSYEIRLKNTYDNILQVVQFNVLDTKQELPTISTHGFSRFRIKNSQNRLLYTEVNIYDLNNAIITQTNSFDPVVLSYKKYNVELLIEKGIKKIHFNNLSFNGDFDLGFEELSNDRVRLQGKNTNKVYAIDPTNLDFDYAIVTAVAEGQELYKCKDYNFEEQLCFGSYEKIMDLEPGEVYTFILTPEDPQYTEQTSDTIACTCTNSCRTAPGSSSQCTATCSDYCDIDFNVPPGAISGWLEMVHYDITLTLTTAGSPVSGSHEGRLDKDETPNSPNDEQIGSSNEYTEATHSIRYENNNMDDSGAKSFDDNSCATWDDGYCTWKPYLFTEYTCQGSRKRCTTTIELDLINYTWNYTSDEEPPSLVVNSPTNNTFTDSTSTIFYYTPNDNLALENCSIYVNNQLNQTNSSLTEGQQTTFTIQNMGDGEFSWYLTCYDTSDNLNTSGTRYLTVDTTNPSISYIDPTPDNNTYLSVDYLTVNVSHTEVNSDTLILYWNNTPESQSYSGSYTNISKTGLSDGVYTYYVFVNDTASNSNQTDTRIITIDTINPTVSLNEPLHDTWLNYNDDIVFNYTPSDMNLENCSLYGNFTTTGIFELNQTDTNPISDQKNNFNPIDIGDGIYVWNVRCFDKSARNSWASSNYTLKVDAAVPNVTLVDPENNTLWNTSSIVNFNYTVEDNFAVIDNCTLVVISNISTETFENNTIQTGVIQSYNEVFANNKYNWTIYCTDPAGNTNNPSYYNLTVELADDTVGPIVIPNSPENNNWTNINNVTLIYTPSDISDIKNCSLYIGVQLNQTNYQVANSDQNNFTLGNLSEGSYRWFVKCVDNSTNYNEGQSSAYKFYVDQTIPSVNQEFPVQAYNTSDIGVNFTWLAQDNMAATMYCDLFVNSTLEGDDITSNNNTYTNQTSTFSNDGKYYWNVTCRDLAFNYQTSNLWSFTIDTTSPYITLINPENNNVSTTGNITFNYIPSDNTSGLDYCYLYINELFNQSNSILLNNQQNIFSINDTASGNYDWQINCTDVFGNLGNSTIWNFIVDVDAPVTNSYTAIPETVDLLEVVNITVNVTDNYGVSVVIAQITYPGGALQNYTMTLRSTDIYNLTFTDTTQRGSYTVQIISNDTYSNKNVSQNYYFFVSPGISIDKVYYDRREQVQVTGSGFDALDNITINITDSIDNIVPGYPTTFLANSTGGFYYVWNISNSTSLLTGNYTLFTYDTFQPGQSAVAYPYLVRKPLVANRYDKNNIGDEVTIYVNESEDNRALIHASSSEDYINLTWQDIVPIGQIISDIRIYVEHIESADNNPIVAWFNTSSLQWKTVCTIVANTTSEVLDSCDINDEVIRSADANNLFLKITDNDNYGSSVGAWTNLDFVFIEVEFTTLTTDKDIYQQGENVTILGSNWPEYEELTINITRSDGITDQQTDTTDGYGEFSNTYQVPYNGSLGQYNVTVYLTSTPEDTHTTFFQVIKRNSSMSTDKLYYGRTETIYVTGIGFSSGGNVTILLYDAQDVLRLNSSTIASYYFNGTIAFNWTIPYDYDGYYGSHKVIARDKLYPNLNGTANITIGILSDISYKIENSIYTEVTSLVNQSDNITASLAVYNGIEDYMRYQFLNATVSNNVLTNITFYIEHNETQDFDLVLEWYNDTDWIDICRISFTNNELFSSCNLINFVDRAPRTNNVTLKITDNQTDFGLPGQNWTYIDYIYLVTWSDPDTLNPEVDILLPQPSSNYNYSQSVLIQVNITENVEVDSVFANVTWLSYSEIITLTPIDVNYYGEGIYEAYFPNTTDLVLYNISIFTNDTSSNYNYTETSNFTIASPDLTSNSTYLVFSNNEPIEGENITINLTIFNNGNANASTFLVQFFVGNYTNGYQINGDLTIDELATGKNRTLNISWIAQIGTHNIQTVIDPPISTNGSIWEINESNNLVNKQIFIPGYHIYFGNTSGLIELKKDTEESKYTWNFSNQGNIYAVETGSAISWLSLNALGRNTSNLTTVGDFEEADIALNMTNLTDSINDTYTVNQYPIITRNFTIYEKIIKFVPIVNSTNTSNFVTGILWDTSDLAELQYNGTQDLIFVTEVNPNQQGKYGVYDYEIKVPAFLDTYKLGTGTVTFYTEVE